MAAFGVLALMTSYILPAYASTGGNQPVAASVSQLDMQNVAVSADASAPRVLRDGFLVTRTTLAGYQPFAHLANTFANNPNSPWRWPFDVGVPISSGFGYRDCSGCGSNHQGLDMNPGEGTPIQSIGEGVVVDVGNPNGAFGVYARIQHEVDGQMFTSLYAHMLQGSLAVEVGDTVSAGDLVGQVGNTGQSTGAHLHFGIYMNGTTAIDPYAFMKGLVGS
ncbi:M23 family metallopeptidase [soil metagenome]